MRISFHTTAALTLSLLTPACDDMTDLEVEAGADDEAADDEADEADEFGGGGTQPRCFPHPCIDPPMGNTNWVGQNPLDTVTQNTWNVPTQLSNGNYVRLTGATCPAVHGAVWRFNATASGELVFYKSQAGGNDEGNKVRDVAVLGCKFSAQFASTAGFSKATTVSIMIGDAVKFTTAKGTYNFKYLMLVANLNADLPLFDDEYHPTCYDNADAQGNYYLQIRPGLVLDTADWRLSGDSSKQSWVCTAGAFGHFGLRNVDVEDISEPLLGTTEGRAWGLYHHGASHTVVGNPIRIHHPAIQGYDSAPDPCAPADAGWSREGLWSNGNLMCRGSGASSWSDEINRNAYSRNMDWDDDSSVASVSVCNGSPNHQFETYAQCYMNGGIRVCPDDLAC